MAEILSNPQADETDASFCESCPFKGSADGKLAEVRAWVYAVGLNRLGAAGVILDENGNTSKPIDLPFKGNRNEFLGTQEPSEYWPDSRINKEVDDEGIVKTVGQCEGPEDSRTLLMRRRVKKCPVLMSHMMSRGTRKLIRNSVATTEST